MYTDDKSLDIINQYIRSLDVIKCDKGKHVWVSHITDTYYFYDNKKGVPVNKLIIGLDSGIRTTVVLEEFIASNPKLIKMLDGE